MSYILDALKTADARRGRDSLPGMHATPGRMVFAPEGAAPRAWIWVVAGMALALLLWLGWRLAPQPVQQTMQPAVPQTAQPSPQRNVQPSVSLQQAVPAASPVVATRVVPVASAVVAVAPAPVPATPAPAPMPALPVIRPAASPAPAPTTQPAMSTGKPAAATAMAPASPAATPVSAAAVVAPSRVSDATTAPAVAAPTAAPRILSLEELPASVRSAWPTLTIQGASYSENASHRLLIVNGQVLHEGETVAPELVLEEIRLKLAVFRFRGQRVGMPY